MYYYLFRLINVMILLLLICLYLFKNLCPMCRYYCIFVIEIYIGDGTSNSTSKTNYTM